MSRPLRILYENAWYHVMNRGANKKNIFHHDKHRNMFLELLAEITTDYSAAIHTYCLMNNHYHLLVQTPLANLPRIMRHLDGVYTQRFNKLNGSDGPLFRGRYKAILVEDSNYLLQVSRYIHLNPVEANLTSSPQEYKWSSYSAYLNPSTRPIWLKTEKVLESMSSNDPITSYAKFVMQGNDSETEKFYESNKLQPIFGGNSFKEQTQTNLNENELYESKSDLKTLKNRPEIELILNHIANYYQTTTANLKKRQRNAENIPRLMAITICRTAYQYRLKKISEAIGNIRPEAVSTANRRFLSRIRKNSLLFREYQEILSALA